MVGPGEGLLEGGVGNRHLVLWQVRLSPPPPAPAAPQLASETNLTREAATPTSSSTLWSSPRPWSQPTSPGWKACSGATSLPSLATGTRPSASESAPPVSRHCRRPGCSPPALYKRPLKPPRGSPRSTSDREGGKCGEWLDCAASSS